MDGRLDATVLELYVDDEPRRVSRRSGLLLPIAASALALAVAWAVFDSGERAVELGAIEHSVGSDLTGQLLGDMRVVGVRCVLESESLAECVAELIDKSGDGPIMQRVHVAIRPATGEYFLQAGDAFRPLPRKRP